MGCLERLRVVRPRHAALSLSFSTSPWNFGLGDSQSRVRLRRHAATRALDWRQENKNAFSLATQIRSCTCASRSAPRETEPDVRVNRCRSRKNGRQRSTLEGDKWRRPLTREYSGRLLSALRECALSTGSWENYRLWGPARRYGVHSPPLLHKEERGNSCSWSGSKSDSKVP